MKFNIWLAFAIIFLVLAIVRIIQKEYYQAYDDFVICSLDFYIYTLLQKQKLANTPPPVTT